MISDFFQWDALGGFIEKVGLSMTIWFVTIFVVYRLVMVFGVKVWDRFGPVIDAHFELIISMKDNLSKQTNLMQQTNDSINQRFAEQTDILKNNSKVLDEIKENQRQSCNLVVSNGIKRQDS